MRPFSSSPQWLCDFYAFRINSWLFSLNIYTRNFISRKSIQSQSLDFKVYITKFIFLCKYMLYFMLRVSLFYYRTLIFVQFLLFYVMVFMFFNSGVLNSLLLLVSLCHNHCGKWDTATMIELSYFRGNNQDSIYELSGFSVEETKV